MTSLWARALDRVFSPTLLNRLRLIAQVLNGTIKCTVGQMIEYFLDGVVIIDPRDRIMEINREAARILGIEIRSARGKAIQKANSRIQPALDLVLGRGIQEAPVEYQKEDQVYELYITNCAGGRMILLRNVTLRHQVEQAALKDRELADERAHRLEIIKNLAEILNQTLPPERALEAGLEMVARQVEAQAGWLLTLTPENKATLSAGYQIPAHIDLARHRDHHWPLCACLREEQAGALNAPIRVFNCERLARPNSLTEPTPKQHLSIPVTASGKPVGILNLIVPEERVFDESEFRTLALYGDQFGGAVERLHLFAEVHKLAITDPLTELFNRRYFFELAEQELVRVRRYGHPLSIAMLDVDLFKRINDTYGHQAGDQVLQTIARISSTEIRQIDIIGRYGGEELIILMPETSHDSAILAMERLRKTIERAEIVTHRGQIQVTVSIGMACKSADGIIDLDQLIEQADQALYLAKQSGRNQVCSWETHLA